jgi:iron complex outermembrane receptor protein
MAGLLLLVSASAQQEPDDNTVFNLDPFVVATDNVGYQARNSLSATKFNIEVREVPITITSLTQEYLEDTYSQSLEDAVRFSAGITTGSSINAEEAGGFYIRGLRTLRSKRNGIIQLYTQDMTNVEKVEVVKGPMSLLYGQVEPGGIINYLTMNALDEFRTTLKLTGGNYEHFRAQLNHTGPILEGKENGAGRLLYRVDSSYKADAGWRDNTKDERSFVSGLLEYKPFASSTVEIQWDYLNQNSFNTAPLPKINKRWREIWVDLLATTPEADQPRLRLLASQDPFTSYATTTNSFGFVVADNSEPRLWDGYAEHWPWKLNTVPVNAFNDIDLHTASIEWRQQLWETWFAKLYVVHHDIRRESIWGQPWGIGISGESGPGYSSNHWDRYNDDYAYQLEITGKWNLFDIENEMIIGLEHLDNNFEAFLSVDGASNMARPTIFEETRNNPNNPYFSPAVSVTNLGNIVYQDDGPLPQSVDEEKRTNAAFISNVARFFGGKWLVLGGLRFDDITIRRFQENQQTGKREEASYFNDTSVSPQIGSSYRVNDALTIYASYSESFVPQSGSTPVLKSGDDLAAELPKPPAERDLTRPVAKEPLLGTGYEFGAKFDLWEDRISGSMSVFHTELTGVEKTFFVDVPGFTDARGEPQSALVGSQDNGREIDGLEMELFMRPVDGLQVVLTYAYIDSVELLASTIEDIRGNSNVTLSIPSVSVPEHQAGLWTKYSFTSGNLDGLSIGGGFNWLDKRFGAYSLRSGNPSAAGFVGSAEAVEDRILLGDQITWDLLVSYGFDVANIDYTLQVNIKNILDERFILPGGMPNEPMRAYVSLQAKF